MILWTSRLPKGELHRKQLTELASRILSDWGNPEAELSILVTGDTEIHRLNSLYRGMDRPTDVLSFSQAEGEDVGSGDVLGDVVISLETAVRQAGEAGCTLEDEMCRLLVHGTLHLIGYDHENGGAGADRMRGMEDKYLSGS